LTSSWCSLLGLFCQKFSTSHWYYFRGGLPDEKIRQYAQKLPLSLQEELLDYAQYLLMKVEQQEKQDKASLSLSSAMRGMEDEPALYSLSDITIDYH